MTFVSISMRKISISWGSVWLIMMGISSWVTDEFRQNDCLSGFNTADPSGKMLTICFPRMREALWRMAPGLTLRSLMANSLSHKKPTKPMSHACTGMPILNMSMTSKPACSTNRRKAAPLPHSSQGISRSGTPNMNSTSKKHHFRHSHSDSSSSTAKV